MSTPTASRFSLFIPQSSLFRLHLLLPIPLILLSSTLCPFLKLCHRALLSLLYQIPVFFYPFWLSLHHFKICNFGHLLIVFTFPFSVFWLLIIAFSPWLLLLPSHSVLPLLDLFFSSSFLLWSHILAPRRSWCFFHHLFSQSQFVFTLLMNELTELLPLCSFSAPSFPSPTESILHPQSPQLWSRVFSNFTS